MLGTSHSSHSNVHTILLIVLMYFIVHCSVNGTLANRTTHISERCQFGIDRAPRSNTPCFCLPTCSRTNESYMKSYTYAFDGFHVRNLYVGPLFLHFSSTFPYILFLFFSFDRVTYLSYNVTHVALCKYLEDR